MRSGAAAMAQAQKLTEKLWPGAPKLTALKSVVWIPDGKGGRRPISRREDLFGVFDLIVLPDLDNPVMIQVTTQGPARSSTSQRKRKIAEWVGEHFKPRPNVAARFHVYLWTWVPRRHFRRWEWSWSMEEWRELRPIRPASISAPGAGDAPRSDSAESAADPTPAP